TRRMVKGESPMLSKLPRSVWFLVIASLALVAAGCGGGEDRLSEDEFLDQFDDACSETNEDLNDIQPDTDPLDCQRDAYSDAQEVVDDGLAEIGDLNPPEDLDGELEDFIDSGEQLSDVLGDLVSAAEDDDEDEFEDIQSEDLPEAVDDREQAADELGSDCFAGSDASTDLSSDQSSDFSTDFSTDFS